VSNRKQRFGFGLLATFVGALMFLIASAYIVFRGYPHWLAAVVGAVAFPVGPVAWHLLGERSRRKKQVDAKAPAKASLTGGDRYWLRCVVVGLIVIGPMIAIGRFDVARAVWKHGLWFVPTHYEPSTTHGGTLSTIGAGVPRTLDVFGTPLQRVPSDAELVITAQAPDEPGQPEGRAVLAYGDKQVMFFAEGKAIDLEGDVNEKVAELNKQRSRMPWLPTEEIQLVSYSDSQLIASSAGWRSRVELPATGPSTDLLAELGRAPKDAFVAAAFVPKPTHDVLSTKAGAAWIVKRGEKLVIEARVVANDEAAAKRLVSEATRALDDAAQDVPDKCREQVGAIVKAVQLDQTGAIVTGRLEVDGAAMMAVAFCAIKDR